MKKTFKYILIVALVIVLLFISFTLRKYLILDKFLKQQEILNNADNYYVKETLINGTINETYYKEGEFIYNSISQNSKNSYYNVGGKTLMIIDSGTGKLEVLEIDKVPTIVAFPNANYYVAKTFIEKLKMTLTTSIKTEECDGVESYCLDDSRVKTWIDKNTYITLQTDNGGNGDSIQKYEIKLNIVTDEDLKEPDISEYTVQENN